MTTKQIENKLTPLRTPISVLDIIQSLIDCERVRS